jgi:two-component system phosphate regulon sensor histidine kinase PhoR
MEILALAALAILATAFGLLWRREVLVRRQAEGAWRRRVEEAEASRDAEQSRARWAELAGASATALILASDRGLHLRYANAAAQALFGPIPPRVTLIGYCHNVELEQLAHEALSGGEGEALERVLTLGGRPYLARAGAREEGVGIALTDVAEVRRLGRARQDMVANLSHELRTPLTSLRLLADTLQVPAGRDPEVARQVAAKITAEVDTLNQMTQEMLDLAAIESGRQVIRMTSVPLARILAAPLDQLAEQLARRHLTALNQVAPDLCVLADATQAARAILNVLHNAVKFSPQGGEIVLTARADPERSAVVLSIADNGPGIPPEELDRIFERFYRGDEARTTPGTGLGLAIVRHIMQAHSGSAWAENREPPHRGAVFHLRFQTA